MKLTKRNFAGALALAVLTLAPSTQYAQTVGLAQSIPFSVGAEVGTTGYGGNVGWRFMNNLGIEGGFDYLQYSYNGKIKDVQYNTKLRFMSEPVSLEVFPWKRSSFRIDLGALFNQERLSGNANGSLTLNGNPYTGTLNLLYKPQTVDPYVGIAGNLYFDHGHHFSLMGALGVAYDGNGNVTLTGTSSPPSAQFQSDLQTERSKVQSYARDLKLWPVIKIGFTYSF